jgi:hypothetical protein
MGEDSTETVDEVLVGRFLAGHAPWRALNPAERVDAWLRHERRGGTATQFSRAYGLSGAAVVQLRQQAA